MNLVNGEGTAPVQWHLCEQKSILHLLGNMPKARGEGVGRRGGGIKKSGGGGGRPRNNCLDPPRPLIQSVLWYVCTYKVRDVLTATVTYKLEMIREFIRVLVSKWRAWPYWSYVSSKTADYLQLIYSKTAYFEMKICTAHLSCMNLACKMLTLYVINNKRAHLKIKIDTRPVWNRYSNLVNVV